MEPTYVFLHEDIWQDALSPCAELMTFIDFMSSVKGWKFMRNTNTIFHATKAVFNENMYPRCPDGSCVNIPAIETGVLPLPDGYPDRGENIPLEDNDDAPCPPPPVESNPNLQPPRPHVYMEQPTGNGDCQSTLGDSSPSIPPSPGLSYKTPSSRREGPSTSGSMGTPPKTPVKIVRESEPYFLEKALLVITKILSCQMGDILLGQLHLGLRLVLGFKMMPDLKPGDKLFAPPHHTIVVRFLQNRLRHIHKSG